MEAAPQRQRWSLPLPVVDDAACADSILFVRSVLRRSGLDPGSYRMGPLLRRIPAALRAIKTDSLKTALSLVEEEPSRLATAAGALLIGTTSFFRDRPVFEQLEGSVIPGILARESRPRVWSVACSDGAELHSVAMLFARGGPLPGSHFLGTDCREAALQTSRRGAYQPSAVENVPADLAEMFLTRHANVVSVAPRLSSMMDWECRDILREDQPGTWDMILCRNLAIYLDATAVKKLWELLAKSLLPQGILVVGKAEKPQVECLRRIGPCIYQKTSAPTA